jgi:hypothetical protein
MYLYLIQQKGSNYFKVGVSGNVKRRLENLQSGNPHKLYIVRYWYILDKSIEALVHNVLAAYHVRLEWFEIPDITRVLEHIEICLSTESFLSKDSCIEMSTTEELLEQVRKESEEQNKRDEKLQRQLDEYKERNK